MRKVCYVSTKDVRHDVWHGEYGHSVRLLNTNVDITISNLTKADVAKWTSGDGRKVFKVTIEEAVLDEDGALLGHGETDDQQVR